MTNIRPTIKRPPRRITRTVRIMLLLVGLGLVAVLAAAAWIRPYDEEGQPRRHGTHTQLGMSPCEFYEVTKKPCPACGLTTSFSFMMHFDPWNAARANPVGILMVLMTAPLAYWCLRSAGRGVYHWGVRYVEKRLMIGTTMISALLLIRWCWIMWL